MNDELKALYDEMPFEYRRMADNWPYDHLVHNDIPEFTGRALTKGRVAGLLNKGEGPETFRILNKKASDKIKFANWMWQRTKNSKLRVKK